MKSNHFVDQVASHVIKLERAKAVLEEVSDYFDDNIEPGSWQAMNFILQREHVMHLVHVVEAILVDEIEHGTAIAKDMHSACKPAREGGAT